MIINYYFRGNLTVHAAAPARRIPSSPSVSMSFAQNVLKTDMIPDFASAQNVVQHLELMTSIKFIFLKKYCVLYNGLLPSSSNYNMC
jgi:hypothetical protein